jgi:hypothetical protein
MTVVGQTPLNLMRYEISRWAAVLPPIGATS